MAPGAGACAGCKAGEDPASAPRRRAIPLPLVALLLPSQSRRPGRFAVERNRLHLYRHADVVPAADHVINLAREGCVTEYQRRQILATRRSTERGGKTQVRR